MTEKKVFYLNGEKYFIKKNICLFDVVCYFNFNTSLFILEYNNTVYSKEKWLSTFIINNDKIEVITIVGGG